MNTRQYFTDSQLLDMLRVNDAQALKVLTSRYWSPLYNYSLEKTNSHTKSVEITSNLFKHLWDERLNIPAEFCIQSYLAIKLRKAVANGMYELLTAEKETATIHTMQPPEYVYQDGFTFRKIFTVIKQTFAA